MLDLADATNAVRVAALSHTHTLQLPDVAVARLVEAHQALLAAHRAIEAELCERGGVEQLIAEAKQD